MAVQQLFTSRIRTANSSSYIGENGRMFYDEALGELRLSNGVTPGGTPITVVANVITTGSLLPTADNQYSIGTDILRWSHIHLDSQAASIYFSANTLGMDSQGSLSYNSGTGNVAFGNIIFQDTTVQSTAYTPGAIYSNLLPGTSDTYNIGSLSYRWGNIYVGPFSVHLQDQTTLNDIEMTVNNGTLYLNGAQNLAVGNLVILDTTLTSATPDLNISIGDTNDTGTFFVKRKAQFDNTTFGPTEAMVSLNASGGTDPDTVFPGTVLQTVSRPNMNSRIVQRSYGSSGNIGGDNMYSVWASFSARGNVASPSAIKQNDILSRLSSNGYGTTTWGSGGTRIESVATENFTDSAKGSVINFWTTAIGTVNSQKVASINDTGILANAITFSTDSSVQTTAGIPLTQKAVANAAYVATLGIDGKLDASQIPSSLVGAVVFKGAWNANTNTPALSDTLPVGLQTGWEYVVSVGGTRDIGDGSELFTAGDFVIYDGTHWKRIAATNNLTYATATAGSHITINGNQGTQETGVLTFASDSTPNNVAGTMVSRDNGGNFQANTITASLSGQATSALTAATVTAGAQPNITSVGTLTSLAVSGNVSTGNVSGTNGVFTRVAGTLTTATQPNITTVGTLTSLTLSGTLTGTTVNAATIGNSGATLTGTLLTNAQPNITSVGNLTSLNVSGNISDSIGSVRSIPQNGQSANYSLQSTDNGQMINITAGNVTVPAGVFGAPYGQTISIFNNQNASNAIVQGSSVTLRLAGTTATGNRTLARYGVATLVCVAANTFVISGAGLS